MEVRSRVRHSGDRCREPKAALSPCDGIGNTRGCCSGVCVNATVAAPEAWKRSVPCSAQHVAHQQKRAGRLQRCIKRPAGRLPADAQPSRMQQAGRLTLEHPLWAISPRRGTDLRPIVRGATGRMRRDRLHVRGGGVRIRELSARELALEHRLGILVWQWGTERSPDGGGGGVWW